MIRVRSINVMFGVALTVAAISGGCSKQEVVLEQDSLLTKPYVGIVDTVRPKPDSSGLLIDTFMLQRSKRNEATLAKFHPKEILKIYEDYRSLRNTAISEQRLTSFLHDHKIDQAELHAILEQGDLLGWATAH